MRDFRSQRTTNRATNSVALRSIRARLLVLGYEDVESVIPLYAVSRCDADPPLGCRYSIKDVSAYPQVKKQSPLLDAGKVRVILILPRLQLKNCRRMGLDLFVRRQFGQTASSKTLSETGGFLVA